MCDRAVEAARAFSFDGVHHIRDTGECASFATTSIAARQSAKCGGTIVTPTIARAA